MLAGCERREVVVNGQSAIGARSADPNVRLMAGSGRKLPVRFDQDGPGKWTSRQVSAPTMPLVTLVRVDVAEFLQIVEKQGEADEATAGLAKVQASLPWMEAETKIRRDAKDLKYGNQVAWVEAERSLVEEQQEQGVLARHRDQALAARAALLRQRD